MASMYPQYESNKRILKGNRSFYSAMLDKIHQNNPANIFTLPPEQLNERLMELAAELLNRNEGKGNFWHLLTEKENLKKAEEIVEEIVYKIEVINSDPAYNDYIDFIRAHTQADQLTDNGQLNKPHTEPGTTGTLPDLYIELLKPMYDVKHGGFEVHASANIPILPTTKSKAASTKPSSTNTKKIKIIKIR